MTISDDYKELLIKKYRMPLFEKENIELGEIDNLISDEDLVMIIELNNDEMTQLINEENIDIQKIKSLFIANLNFYQLANYREISVFGKSFMMSIGTILNYDLNKLFKIMNSKMHKTLKTK